MYQFKAVIWGAALGMALTPALAQANVFAEAIEGGKSYGDLRLRYEAVDQNNALQDASALTLRTRLGFATAAVNGFSATVEFEDSRTVLGEDDYSLAPTGFKPGQYSVIADPETTELDQAFLQYKHGGFSAKFGRQVLTFDNHRFIGHVGWRQDRQTFDGLRLGYQAGDVQLALAYIEKRNRIFAEAADIDSKDLLANVGWKTSAGKLSAYSYLLEVDNNTDNALDTYGLRWVAKATEQLPVSYTIEVATQRSESGGVKRDADYYLVELGTKVKKLALKAGYEVLGSDGGNYGFSTPLATGHKFNGWADSFLATPNQGLTDIYLTVAGKLAGGKWAVTYHDFAADKATASIDDLGSEWDLLYARKLDNGVKLGVKYAAYSAGDAAAGKVDTDKLWIWTSIGF